MFNSKLYWTLSYFGFYTITGCISVSAFASLLGISVAITSSAIGLKICAINSEIKMLIWKLREQKKAW